MRRVDFDSEDQLVRAIVVCASRARRRDYRVEFELDAGVGIADLVFAKRSPHSTESLRALGKISPRLAVLLRSGVGDGIRSRAQLAAVLGASEGVAQRLIAQLTTAGLAKESSDSLQIFTVKSLPYERLVAVEAKISNLNWSPKSGRHEVCYF